MKSAKGITVPPTSTGRLAPVATVNTTRNNRVVIAGAQIVWRWTLKKRRTSFT